ncbi:PREDICTED: TANK-binding kinase 1-binding protein 1 [Corvus brachyrhynchos]|uniref:TANK-binding kinase 1-binding protein 1 n=1 Tax=Corvus brachyrhynchos TaxID=85066 RepID=UPI00081675A9|nr:PREDICTED: TANK-binding kinase 1-binding protein 1 [Corvus brachyrhynchos]
MDSMFEDDISILTQEALGPDEDWLDSPNTDLKSKEREEQLEEMIQAYEKLCVEKADLETELGEMVGAGSRARCPSGPTVSPSLGDGSLRGGVWTPATLGGWGSGCSQGVCCPQEQSERDMGRVKKVGDDQVNLALAYTELTEELCRLRNLSSLQSQILRALLQEKSLNGGQRHSPLSQCHSPAQQRRSPAPQCPSPAPPGRSQCQSPALRDQSTPPTSPPFGGILCVLMTLAPMGANAGHVPIPVPPQLLLETVDSEVRSCPLCQLAFPIGYPDDALVKHIDSHLENSKI